MADRYAFTAFARDVARGVIHNGFEETIHLPPMPDLTLYFRVPLDVAVDRILSSRAKIKYYEAGMDLGLSDNKVTSFRLFQQRVIDEYEKMVDEFGMTVVDGTESVQKEQKPVRQLVTRILRGWEGLPNPFSRPRRRPIYRSLREVPMHTVDFYGAGFLITPLKIGREAVLFWKEQMVLSYQSQIQLLRIWLEDEGYAVSDTGLHRSPLTQAGLESAKNGHTLSP